MKKKCSEAGGGETSESSAGGRPPQNQISIPSLQGAPALLGVGTASWLAFSVCYDWGYFNAIDTRLFLHLSLNDHISAAIDRMPYIVAILVFAWILSGPLARFLFGPPWKAIAGPLPKDVPNTPTLSYEESSRKLKRWVIGSTAIVYVVLAIDALLNSTWYYPVIGLGIFFWATCTAVVSDRIKDNYKPFSVMVVGLSAAVTLLPMVVGYSVGREDMVAAVGRHDIVFNDGDRIKGALVLRFTGSSVLIRDVPKKKISLLSWQNIKEVSRNQAEEPKTLLCTLAGLCLPAHSWLKLSG